MGIYPIQVTSEGSSLEKSIEYKESVPIQSSPDPDPDPKPVAKSSSPKSTVEPPRESESTSDPKPVKSKSATTADTDLQPVSSFTTLKLQIPNFPSLDKSPQYYIDRYNNEPNYKSWFDSQFPFNSIYDVVGYAPTTVDGFPSLDKSPQYYIDRYNNEPNYKSGLIPSFLLHLFTMF